MKLPYLGIEVPDDPEVATATDYLNNHFLYYTMNSNNGVRSFAHCIKVPHLNISYDDEIKNRVYEMLEIQQAYDEAGLAWEVFAEKYDYKFQIGTNGRSGGYAVLYKGGIKPSGHLSYCPHCGQRNYQLAVEGRDKCGVCHAPRKNYTKPPMTVFTMPGQSLSDDWRSGDAPIGPEDVMYFFGIVRDFDIAVEDFIASFVDFARTHRVEEREVLRPETINVAVEIEADDS